jgi:DNA-3-methyladenine glycosylase II
MPTRVPQTADRDRALDHLRRADPVLAPLIAAHPDFDPWAWRKELPPFDAFGALLFQVIGQQLSIAATRGILGRVQVLFGGKLPTPAELLAAAPEDLHRTGLSRRKVATLRAVAEEFVAGRLSDEQLRHLSDEEIEARLTAIAGIGPWTVQGFLIIALDRQDVVLPGDLALRKSVRRLYGMDHLPSQQEVLQLSERWRPYRSLATSYLFQAAFDAAT